MPTRRISSLVIAASGLAALSLGLAGCATASSPAAAPTTPVSRSSATPSATATPAGFSTTCGVLIPTSVITTIDPSSTLAAPESGTDEVAPPATPGWSVASLPTTTDPLGPPSRATQLAALQSGFFDCTWSTSGGQLVLDVLPDATASFTAEKNAPATNTASSIRALPASGLGDASFGACENTVADFATCHVDVLEGSMWVRLQMGVRPAPTTTAGLAAVETKLHDGAASALSTIVATGAQPAAKPQPTSTWNAVTQCSQMLTGSTTPSPSPSPGSTASAAGESLDLTDQTDPVLTAAVEQSGGIGCYGSAQTVFVVKGAGWTAPDAYADADVTATPLTLAGVTDARYLCEASTRCWSEGVVDHAFVMVVGDSQDADSATLTSIATNVARH